MAHLPLTPPHLPINTNTTLTGTPVFVPTPQSVLAIQSYFGLGGPGLAVAFLYNPLEPRAGIAVDEQGRLAPVLEARWREFERAVAGAQEAMRGAWGVGSYWSRPQNTTCPTDVYYDLGPGNDSDSLGLERFTLSGHTVSVSSYWNGYDPDDVKWYNPALEYQIKVVDEVPAPFVEVERIIRSLADELLPWDDFSDWSEAPPMPPDVRAMVRAVAVMAQIRRRRGMRFLSDLYDFPG
ncbi:hypothetical protein C8R46DRAFT_1213527 [Mycena filopes]|nr:hypothetical protein C8R46DRAFT_1213527 [Mycena filopes]